jgi:uncharacterized membrane protein YgaE (UPF0421/DUF939 family)
MKDADKEIIKEIVAKQIEQQMKEFVTKITNETINENGNSSIKNSGNGFVYVDNTGIAYAMILFYKQFIENQNVDSNSYDSILEKLENLITENRKLFKEMIKPKDSGD